ncbi:hypothetical protein B7R21_18060 [Subtercola boreus]|uniref:Uncharacterized protein n=2 Tax=Subtercola boreus TaxID=120213 RepID=A0A3E0VAN3_9MICO|nr:hypothetical protein B7R21_18060 [Subtercola boreus]
MYAAELGPTITVDVEDSFSAQSRNADYPEDDWFSDAHVTFAEDGRPGFADFTILPAMPQPGGGPAGAVSLHLSWENGSDRLHVQHFLSDERDRNLGSAGGKILEALAHLQAERARHPSKFRASPGLAAFDLVHAQRHATSLVKSKQYQISHHIYTVAAALGA